MNIDITMKFVHAGNMVSGATDYDAKHIIIEDGIPEETLLQLMMNNLFPEYRVFDGWDEDVLAHGRVILLPEGEHSKDGFVLLYQDSSLVYVVEHDGEIVIRYIGDAAEMGQRMDDLHCVKPKTKNWFTANI